MFKYLRCLAFLLCLPLASSALAQSDQGSLVRLGVISVTPGAAGDRVDLSAVQGRSNAVLLVAEQGTAAIDQIAITYANGQSFIDDTDRKLNLKDRTRLINERPGDARFVDAVEVVYQAAAKPSRQGRIVVWGRQTAAEAAEVRPTVTGAPSVVTEDARLLARKSISLLVDRDAATLTDVADPGGKLRILADRPIRIQSITLTDAAGASETIAIDADLQPGAPSAWFDVRTTRVRTIAVTYRPEPSTGGVVNLEIYGSSAVPPPPTKRSIEDEAVADNRGYTEVPVFFGTDRVRGKDLSKNGRTLAVFTGEGMPAESKATLGMSVVTVPKERDSGSINRPDWNFYLFTFAFRNEDLKRDFTIQSVDVLPEDQFVEKAKQRIASAEAFKDSAMVFVHGYNVTFDDALFRTAQMAYDTRFDGAAFLYSWPSRGGLFNYNEDSRRVLGSRDSLAEFLRLIQTKTGAKRIHLIAHSMGAHLLTEVLRDEKRFLKPDGTKPFDELIFAAPDVTNDNFTRMATKFKALAKGVTLYASSKDVALSASGRLSGTPAGLVPSSGKPIVVPGVDSIDVSAASTDFFALNHSDFADRIPLLLDMGALFDAGVHPPLKRNGKGFSAIGRDPGLFWRLLRQATP